MSEYLDYKQFRSQFDFIFLSGLKGQERVCEIQDKDTNKMYDYKEIIKEGEDIEKQKELCKELTTLSHPNLLKLQYYSYCFIEETHGNPYCKFFLVFEYCESSLDREIQTLIKKKKFMKTHRMTNIFISLISSLHYLHGMKTTHGDLIPEFVCLTEKDEYKLMPQIQVKPKKNYKLSKFKSSIKDIYKKKPNIHRISMEITEEKKKNEKKTVQNKNLRKESDDILTPPNDFDFSKTYCSPEVYIDDKNRVAYERLKIDPFLSEIFSLGMLFLSVGILENLNQFYKTFTVDTNFLNEKLVKFETLHGKRLFSILCKFLEIDPIKRCSLESALEYLNSEKEIYSPYMPSRGVEDMKKNLKMNKSSKKLLKNQAFSSDLEEKDENALTKKLFNQLPQEHQDEIDKKISEQLRIIEDEKYPTDMFISGDRYQGQKEDDIPHGWGIYWWANGERYEGHFNRGKYDGEGIYFWPTGVKHYGEFRNGEITGIGVRYDSDGGIYYGEWYKGKNHGKGTYFWSTGAKYQGGFIEDMIYGKGVLTWPEEDQKTVRHYEGLWKDVNPKGITVEQMKQSQINK